MAWTPTYGADRDGGRRRPCDVRPGEGGTRTGFDDRETPTLRQTHVPLPSRTPACQPLPVGGTNLGTTLDTHAGSERQTPADAGLLQYRGRDLNPRPPGYEGRMNSRPRRLRPPIPVFMPV